MSLKTIAIADINIGTSRIRTPRISRVAAIARFIAENGFREPIEVSPAIDGRYELIAGWVRIEAVKLNGGDTIIADVRRATADERRKREIESNLIGDGNTVLDRARYLAAAKAIYEAEYPETRHGGARRGEQLANDFQLAKVGDLLRFSAYAAERFGMAERSIQRACAIGEGLDIKAAQILAPTPWADHQQGLSALSRLSATSQLAVAKLLTRAREPVQSFSVAIDMVEGVAAPDAAKRAWSAAYGGYSRMSAPDRRNYLREIVRDKLVPPGVQIIFGAKETV